MKLLATCRTCSRLLLVLVTVWLLSSCSGQSSEVNNSPVSNDERTTEEDSSSQITTPAGEEPAANPAPVDTDPQTEGESQTTDANGAPPPFEGQQETDTSDPLDDVDNQVDTEAQAQAEADASEEVPSRTDPITIQPAESWHLRGDANVATTVGDIVFVGGNFTEIYNNAGGSLRRTYLAAFDRYTGEPTSFAPELDNQVFALAVSPDNQILYVGGSFLTAQGMPRPRIAAYSISTGLLDGFSTPPLNNSLRAIAVAGGQVYLGGLFTQVGTEDRAYLAAFDAGTGELDDSFNVSLDARVTSLVAGIDRLWLGGNFNRVNGEIQRALGAVDPVDGSYQATDDVAYPVIALAASDSQLFIAGGGQGGRAAAFSRATGTEQWEISSDGNFQAVDVGDGRYVYFGGHYESIEGDRRVDRLTRHDKSTGMTDYSWLPRLNGIRSINAVDVTEDGLHIGGDFTHVNGRRHEGFAILPGLTR